MDRATITTNGRGGRVKDLRHDAKGADLDVEYVVDSRGGPVKDLHLDAEGANLNEEYVVGKHEVLPAESCSNSPQYHQLVHPLVTPLVGSKRHVGATEFGCRTTSYRSVGRPSEQPGKRGHNRS